MSFMECSKCGRGYGKFFDVITGEGIVKICSSCFHSENVPVVRKPTEKQIQGENKNTSIYDRLSKEQGLNPEEHKKNIFKKEELKEQEVTLRDLVDKKYDNVGKKEVVKKRDDLVDNFHWILMRARRNKKMTVTDLAKEVGESERVIKMAEQGVLPEGDIRIVQKLETILGINLFKPEIAEMIALKRKQLGFDEFSAKELTISDLQEMKKDSIQDKKVEVKKEPYWRRVMGKLFRSDEEELVDVSDIVGEEVPAVERAEKREEIKEVDEALELETMDEMPIEFDDTSLEIVGEIKEKKVIEEESKEEKASQERDLTQDEIDDLIFGRK